MADKGKIVADRHGNVAVYDKNGRLAQVMVDGKVRNVGLSEADRDDRKGRG